MKQIVIAGASGFIGRVLVTAFKEEGWRVVAVSRSGSGLAADRTVAWSDDPASPLGLALSESDALINLSGRSIMTRFTPKTMEEIRSSRVETTEMLASILAKLKAKPKVWVNASAIGIYGDRGEKALSEASPKGSGFLPEACADWESALFNADLPEVRRTAIRIGIVLGQGGGAFEQLSRVTKIMAGSALGDGRQYMSWIHLQDLVRMFVWAVKTEGICGPINGTAPNPVTNGEVMAAFRSAYGRPYVPPAPAFVLKWVMPLLNMEASLLLEGQRVVPEMALSRGFTFNYPQLDEAMADLVP